MRAWATWVQAQTYWPDSVVLDQESIENLLRVATEQTSAYAPVVSRLIDVSTVINTNVITAVGAVLFDEDDEGSYITGGSGIPQGTTIQSVVSPTSALLSQGATATLGLSSISLIPASYSLATIYHARDLATAMQSEGGTDILGFGDYAIRRRPLSGAVKSMLRPSVGVPAVG